MKKFEIYNEKNRVKGCVAVEYTAIARDEEEVIRLAEEQEVDITGYTIELAQELGKTRFGREIKAEFKREF